MIKWFKNLFKVHPKCLGCGKRHEGAVTLEKLAGMKAEMMGHMVIGPGHPLYDMLKNTLERGKGFELMEQDPTTGKLRKATRH